MEHLRNTLIKNDQNFWNLVFIVLFLALTLFFGGVLWMKGDVLPLYIPLFDFFLIVLATFRLTRLFVYDKITQFLRDLFLNIEELPTETGETLVRRVKPAHGPRRTVIELLECPWCTGVWMALFVTFFYFYSFFAWFPLLLLATAGLGSLFQIIANALGWTAESLKQTAHRK